MSDTLTLVAPPEVSGLRRGEKAAPLPSVPTTPLLTEEQLPALAATLHERIAHLRVYHGTTKAKRPECLAYIERMIERVADSCDLQTGWRSRDDPFTDTALAALRLEFAELTAPGNPYPAWMDRRKEPFAQGRRHNGKF